MCGRRNHRVVVMIGHPLGEGKTKSAVGAGIDVKLDSEMNQLASHSMFQHPNGICKRTNSVEKPSNMQIIN